MSERKIPFNRHHLNFPRALHDSQPQLANIRNHHSLIVPMDVDVHRELHEAVALVPAMSHHMASRALRGFLDYGYGSNYIQNIGNLQKSIQEAMLHPRATDLEVAVGELAMYALDIQKPFIRDGLVDPRSFRRGER